MAQLVKNPPANEGNTRDLSWPPDQEDPLEKKNGNPLQYFCQENPMDRKAWWATVHGIAKSDMSEHVCMHAHNLHPFMGLPWWLRW